MIVNTLTTENNCSRASVDILLGPNRDHTGGGQQKWTDATKMNQSVCYDDKSSAAEVQPFGAASAAATTLTKRRQKDPFWSFNLDSRPEKRWVSTPRRPDGGHNNNHYGRSADARNDDQSNAAISSASFPYGSDFLWL